MTKSISSFQQPTNSFDLYEKKIRTRRIIFRILSVILIIVGWSIPLLMIIDLIPTTLFLMFLGTGLMGTGSLITLLISCGEI